jgi:UDP-N-acetylmuramate dehydrogenase
MQNRGITITGEDDNFIYVRAAAGRTGIPLSSGRWQQGLGGLENLSLIPGSVGAAPIQNIGAYGIEIKDRFHSLRAFDLISGELTLDREACRFGYRDSIFKHALRDRAVVLEVTFALPAGSQRQLCRCGPGPAGAGHHRARPRDIAEAVIAIRTRKLPDPARIGNAGSFFKNPIVPARQRDILLAQCSNLVSYRVDDAHYKLAAGWLIDRCGWKGKSMGRAGVYEQQALVLVNRGGATGAEVARLAKAIQDDVLEKFGVQLEPEPVFI